MLLSSGKKIGRKKQTRSKLKKHAASSVHKEKTAEMDDEMDLDKALYPLTHHLHDRSELVEQMFRTMSGRLDALIPDSLKDVRISELKRLCVQHLEVMSKKRIRTILAGEEMESSSGTEDSRNEVLEPMDEGPTSLPPDSTNSELVTGQPHLCEVIRETDMLELHPESEEEDNFINEHEQVDDIATDLTIPLSKESSSICMEILELEQRARAIKSLLKSQPRVNNI